jgi:SAM-dependent methyltransferase
MGYYDGVRKAHVRAEAAVVNRMNSLKDQVREFWNNESCGEVYAHGESEIERMREQARRRYELEPYIPSFAHFGEGEGQRVLEIGVGMGADHLEWAKARPHALAGVDLTPRAIEWTRSRLNAEGFDSDLRVSDAEALPFADSSFDNVYSWGVIHHSPDIRAAVREIHRVLKVGGVARVMIYHSRSLVGILLWTRYALLVGKPKDSLTKIYAEQLESPGTKAYSPAEAHELFSQFSSVTTRVELSVGDLLLGAAGQRHEGLVLRLLRRIWPRWFVSRFLRRQGLFLLIEARR